MEIYRYTNKINGKVYIGMTTRDVEIRHNEHVSDINDGTYFHRALKKYGIEGFVLEVIDTANDVDELKDKEKYWIGFYYSFAQKSKGYNLTLGGDGALGAVCSDETRLMLSESKRGKKNHMFGRTCEKSPRFHTLHSEETRIKMSIARNKRAKLSEETKRKISSSLKGKYTGEQNSMFGKTGTENPSARKLLCVTTREVFNYMKKAAKKYGVDLSSISACCRGRVKSAGKHPVTGEKLVWAYC